MKRKPPASVIQSRMALSAARLADPLSACNICGEPSDSLAVWREHDEHDRPIDGTDYLVYIGKDHKKCLKRMDDHPRLYAEVRGEPGSFPRLCGPCRYRDGLACRHPKLKANGGDGLLVNLADPLRGAIVCMGGGRRAVVVHHALKCEGREERES